MANPAPAFPLGSGALAVLSTDALLRRLPAETRAAVSWAQKPIRGALHELREGALTDEVVRAAARRTWPAVKTITLAFLESFAASRDEWRAIVAVELQQ